METAHHYAAVDVEVVDQVEAVDQMEVAVEMSLNHVAVAVDGAQVRISISRGIKSVFHIIRFRYSQSCSGLSDRQLLSTGVYGQHESSNQIHLSAMR